MNWTPAFAGVTNLKMRTIVQFLLLISVFTGCDKTPSRRLTDPAPEGAVSQNGGSWVLYDEEVRTDGGFYLIPIPTGNQTLDVGNEQSAAFGKRSIFYSWTGGDVLDPVEGIEHTFAGFGLLVAENIDQMNTTPAKDLSGAGFTKITFYARGYLSENTILRVEGPGDGSAAAALPRLDVTQLTGTWTKFTLPAPGAIPTAAFQSVRQYVNFTFVFSQPSGTTNPGNGGQVFLDRIAYEQ